MRKARCQAQKRADCQKFLLASTSLCTHACEFIARARSNVRRIVARRGFDRVRERFDRTRMIAEPIERATELEMRERQRSVWCLRRRIDDRREQHDHASGLGRLVERLCESETRANLRE